MPQLSLNLALLLGSAGAFMVGAPCSARAAAAAALSPAPLAPALPRLPRAAPLMQDAAEDLEEDEVVEVVEEVEEVAEAEAAITAPPGWEAVQEELWSPDQVADIRIEGGSTLKTFKMPAHAERVQYILQSPAGRPVKGKVELWIGPIRCVHELIYDSMSGFSFPLKATLKFKKLSPVLKVSTHGTYEFPLECGVFVPSAEDSKKIGEITEEMFKTAPMKHRVQGGSTIDNKGGAVRTFNIDPSWEKTQIMVWSKDVGKKSFKTNIEVLQGPNNQKQHLNLRCGGSTQPYHAVIDTPGPDWIIRCNSKKYIEDGLFEIAVAPYGETIDLGAAPLAMNPGVEMGGDW